MALTREQILAKNDLPREEVHLPTLGGSVFVRAMTGSERDRFEAEQRDAKGADTRARVAAYSLADADGKLLFTGADVPALGRLPAATLERVFDVALRLNRIGEPADGPADAGRE